MAHRLPILFLLCCLGLPVAALAAVHPLEVEIEGAGGRLEKNLRVSLSLAQLPCDAPEWRVRAHLQQLPQQLRDAARAVGYYHVRLLGQRLVRKGKCWHATLKVAPGPVTILEWIGITLTGPGKDDPAFRALVDHLPMRPGDPLDHGKYEAIKRRLRAIALERGYFDARFTRHRLRVDPAQNKARIRLILETGRRYRLGRIRIHQDFLLDRVVRHMLTIRPGEPYDSEHLAATQEALSASGLFRQITLTPALDEARDGRVPIDIRLTPAKRFLYRVGLGVSTDTGPHIRLGFENRRLNHRGHRLALEMKLSQKDSNLSGEYFIPLSWRHHKQLSLNAGVSHQETDTSTSDLYTIGTTLLGRRGPYDETLSLSYKLEASDIGDEHVESQMLLAGGNWGRRKVTAREPFLFGHRYELDLKGAYKGLLSDVSVLRLRLFGRWLRPLGAGRLLLRGELGTLFTNRFEDLPASLRFFAGGDLSLRGYGYQALGPKDDQGHVVGGRHLLLLSAEYEHRVAENWSLAAFVDGGNAFDGVDLNLKSGAGAGLRWYSPVGRFGLDLAVPSDTSADHWRLHLTMGAAL